MGATRLRGTVSGDSPVEVLGVPLLPNTCSHTRTQIQSHTHTFTHVHTLTRAAHSHACTHIHTLAHSCSLTLSLTLAFTHNHTLTVTHTLTHAHPAFPCAWRPLSQGPRSSMGVACSPHCLWQDKKVKSQGWPLAALPRGPQAPACDGTSSRSGSPWEAAVP